MSLFTKKAFVIVDVETTGSSPVHDRVIEIGLLRVETGKVVDTFTALINPGVSISPWIERITGISPADLVGAPAFEDVRGRIEEMLAGAIFVAHNARFDYGFIKNELKRSGVSYNAKCLCTVRLSRKLFPSEKHHDLSTIIEKFGFTCASRHRAFDDAKVLWDFIVRMKTDGRGDEMERAMNELLKENTLPQFLDERTVRSLPEGPGVYMFYGPDEELLYVGKSKNVRYRVLSHFSNDAASTKEMHLCQQTVRVEALATAGELGALLLESELVKSEMPIYNRQLRRQSDLVVVKKTKVGDYAGAKVERIKTLAPEDQRRVLGVFRSEKQAKEYLRAVCAEHGLCPRLCGLEKGRGACWSRQLGACKGACVGEHDGEEYAQAFTQAFKARRVKSWPFGGPILIEERVDDESKHSFVLDQWCLIASITTEPDDMRVVEHSPRFDYDSYKIFSRYLRDPLNRKKIRRMTQKELDQALVYIS